MPQFGIFFQPTCSVGEACQFYAQGVELLIVDHADELGSVLNKCFGNMGQQIYESSLYYNGKEAFVGKTEHVSCVQRILINMATTINDINQEHANFHVWGLEHVWLKPESGEFEELIIDLSERYYFTELEEQKHELLNDSDEDDVFNETMGNAPNQQDDIEMHNENNNNNSQVLIPPLPAGRGLVAAKSTIISVPQLLVFPVSLVLELSGHALEEYCMLIDETFNKAFDDRGVYFDSIIRGGHPTSVNFLQLETDSPELIAKKKHFNNVQELCQLMHHLVDQLISVCFVYKLKNQMPITPVKIFHLFNKKYGITPEDTYKYDTLMGQYTLSNYVDCIKSESVIFSYVGLDVDFSPLESIWNTKICFSYKRVVRLFDLMNGQRQSIESEQFDIKNDHNLRNLVDLYCSSIINFRNLVCNLSIFFILLIYIAFFIFVVI